MHNTLWQPFTQHIVVVILSQLELIYSVLAISKESANSTTSHKDPSIYAGDYP